MAINFMDRYVKKSSSRKRPVPQKSNSWLSNALKSMGYSTFDVLTELMPSTIDVAKTTATIGQDMATAIRNNKTNDRNLKMQLEKSFYAGLGKDIFKNSLEDLKTGKFYNKERQDKYFSDMDNDMMGDLGDFDFGEDFDGGDDFSASVVSDDGDAHASFSRKSGGHTDVTDITVNTDLGPGSTMVQSTEYQTETMINVGSAVIDNTKVQHRSLLTLLGTMQSQINTSLVSIGDNVSKVTEVVSNSLVKTATLSAKYYEDSIALQTQILEVLKNNQNPGTEMNTKKFKQGMDVMEMVSSYGSIDPKAYLDLVKRQGSNFIDSNMVLSQLKFMDSNREAMSTQALSPLADTMTKAITSFIPKITRKAMAGFDRQLKETGIAALNQVSGLQRSDNPILRALGQIFGVQNKVGPTKVSKSDYNKGAMSWSGTDHQALTNVIPTLLRKIYANISGTQEVAFDYEHGVFRNVKDIEKEKHEMQVRRETSGFGDYKSGFQDFLDKNFAMKPTDKKTLREEFSKLIQNAVRDSSGGRTFRKGGRTGDEVRNGTKVDDIRDLLRKGSSDDDSVKLIRSYFETLEKSDPSAVTRFFGSAIQEQREAVRREMEEIQKDPVKYNTMYWDTGLDKAHATDSHLKFAKNDKSKVAGVRSGLAAGPVDKYKRNSLYYLRNILNTLAAGIYVIPLTKANTVSNDSSTTSGNTILDANGNPISTTTTTSINNNNPALTEINKINKIRDAVISKLATDAKNERAENRKNTEIRDDYNEQRKQKDIEDGKIDVTDQDLSQESITAHTRATYLAEHNVDENVEKPGFLGKLLSRIPEDSGLGKIIANITAGRNKAGEKAAGVFDTLNKALFDLVFGTGEKGKGFTSLFNKALGVLKSGFFSFTTFLDTKIFKPLNEALFGENGLVKRIKESQFGQKFSEIFKNFKLTAGNFLLGEKVGDTRQGGLFSETANSLKDIGKDVKEQVFGKKGPDGKRVPLDQDDSIFGNAKKMFKGISDKVGSSLGIDKSSGGSFGKRLSGLFKDLTSRFKSRATEWSDNMFGVEDKKSNKFNALLESEFSKRFKSDLKGQKGYIGATASIGALASFFLPGGPIGGALLGTGYGILKKSTGLQEALFGKKDNDGNRLGGLISAEFQKLFKGNKFGMGFGSLAGLLSSFGLLPSFFLPGGPIGGALIGTGASIIANTGAFQNFLYGTGGSKDNPVGGLKEKLQKIFGKDKDLKELGLDAGIGAGLGFLGSFFLPGGPIISSLLGSAISVGTATDKFKNWFFGEDTGDGKRRGGIFNRFTNFMKEEIFIPLGKTIRVAQSHILEFVEVQMVNPFKFAMQPLVEEAKLIKDSVKEKLTGLFSGIKKSFENRVVKPIGDTVKKFFLDPLKKTLNVLFSGLGKLIGGFISAPFKLFSAMGMGAYQLQKGRGRRDYRKSVDETLNPFDRENWTNKESGFFNKVKGFTGAVKNWGKARTDRDKVNDAQYSDKGAWYDRDQDVKLPQRYKNANDEIRRKRQAERDAIKYGSDFSFGDFFRGLFNFGGSDDSTGSSNSNDSTKDNNKPNAPDSGDTKVDTSSPDRKDRTVTFNRGDNVTKIIASYKGDKPNAPNNGDTKVDSSSPDKGRKITFNRGDNVTKVKASYKPGKDKDKPNAPDSGDTKVDTSSPNRKDRKITFNRGDNVTKIKASYKPGEDKTGQHDDAYKPEKDKNNKDTYKPEKDKKQKGNKYKDPNSLLSRIQKDVYKIERSSSRISDSVYGQLNGVGSNINKIYRLLLKKFGVKDDDIKGDNNKSFMGFFQRLRTKLNNPIKAATDFITAPFRKIGDVFHGIVDKFNNLGDNILKAGMNILGGFLNTRKLLSDGFKNLMTSAGKQFKSARDSVVEQSKKLFKDAQETYTNLKKSAKELYNNARENYTTLKKSAKEFVDDKLDQFKKALPGFKEDLKNGITMIGSSFKIVLKSLSDKVDQFDEAISKFAKDTSKKISEKAKQLKESISKSIDDTRKKVSDKTKQIKESLSKSFESFGTKVSGFFDGIGKSLTTLKDKGKEKLLNIWGKIKTFGKNFFGGIGKGLKSALGKVTGLVQDKVGGLGKKKVTHVIVDGGVLDKVKVVKKVEKTDGKGGIDGGKPIIPLPGGFGGKDKPKETLLSKIQRFINSIATDVRTIRGVIESSSNGYEYQPPANTLIETTALAPIDEESGEETSGETLSVNLPRLPKPKFGSNIRGLLKRKDDAERANQVKRGSASSVFARIAKEDKEDAETSYRSKIISLLTNTGEVTKRHALSFIKTFDLKKGLITAGIIALAPFIMKLFTAFDIGGLLTSLVNNIATGFKEIGGFLGLINNVKENTEQGVDVINSTDTHTKVDENGNLVYDENGNLETETTRSTRLAELLTPTRTRIDTETGEWENKKEWTNTSDSVVNFGTRKTINVYRRANSIYDAAKPIAKTVVKSARTIGNKVAGTNVAKNVSKGAKATFDAVKSSAKPITEAASGSLTTAIEFMKKALKFLADKMVALGEKYGIKIAESKLGLGAVKSILNPSKLKAFSGKIAEFLKGLTAKGTVSAGTLFLAEIGFALYGAIDGATNAGALFEVNPSDVDVKMRAIAGVFKALLTTSIGAWVDLINSLVYEILGFNFIKTIASHVYNLLSDTESEEELKAAQDQFTADYETYVEEEYAAYVKDAEENGQTPMTAEEFKASSLSTTRTEYNSKTNRSISKRIVDAVGGAASGIKNFGKTIVTAGGNLISGAKDLGGKAITGIKNFGGNVVEGAKNIGGRLISGAKDLGGKAITGIKNFGGNVIDGAKDVGGKILDFGKNLIGNASNFIKEKIDLLIEEGPGILKDIGSGALEIGSNALTGKFSEFYKNTPKVGSDNPIIGGISGFIFGAEKVLMMPIALLTGLVTSITGFIKDIVSNAIPTLKNIGTGVVNVAKLSIGGDLGRFYGYTSQKTEDPIISDMSNVVFGIQKVLMTPLALLTSVGKGIFKFIGGVIDAAKPIAGNILTGATTIGGYALTGNISSFYGYRDTSNSGIWSGITNALFGIEKTLLTPVALVTTAGRGIYDFITGAIDTVIDFGSDTTNFVSRLNEYTDPDKSMSGWDSETLGSGDNVIGNVIGHMIKGVMGLYVGAVRAIKGAFSWIGDLVDGALDFAGDVKDTVVGGAESIGDAFTGALDFIGNLGKGGNDGGRPIDGGRGGIDDEEPYYSQNDPKYKNKRYKQTGGKGAGSDTMGESGCGPTAMAMVASKMTGKSYDPMSMASLSEAGGYSTPRGTSPGYFTAAANTLGIDSQVQRPSETGIDSSLSSGNSVILQGVKSKEHNSPFTSEGHYVTAIGADDGTVTVHDPRGPEYSGKYAKEDVLNDATGMWSFSPGGKGPSDDNTGVDNTSSSSSSGGNLFTAEDVIAVALNEVGYEEKRSAKDLDKPHANAGNNNHTKYEKEVFGSSGNYWCASFVSWCFYVAAGRDKAKAAKVMGKLSMACETIRSKFKSDNRYSNTPQPGDCIFFSGSRHAGANHIGIVTKVTSSKVYTVEGNTSSKSYNDNGGCVAEHEYALTSNRILGYGHPNYDGSSTFNGVSSSDGSTSGTTSASSSGVSSISELLGGVASTFSSSILESMGIKTKSDTSSTSTDSSSSDSGNYSGSTAQEQVWSYFKNKGIPDEGIAGLMGNIESESNFRYNVAQNSDKRKRLGYTDAEYTSKTDDGSYANFDTDSIGYGLAQWTSSGRKKGLRNTAKTLGKSVADPQSQLDWLWKELNTSYSKTLNSMKKGSSVKDVSYTVLMDFERPKSKNSPITQSKRASQGQKYYEKFHGKDISNMATAGQGGKDGGKPLKLLSGGKGSGNAYSATSSFSDDNASNVSQTPSSMVRHSQNIDSVIKANTFANSMTNSETAQLLNAMVGYLAQIVTNTGDASVGINELASKDFGANVNNVVSTTNNVVSPTKTNTSASTKNSNTVADRSKYNMAKRIAAGILT